MYLKCGLSRVGLAVLALSAICLTNGKASADFIPAHNGDVIRVVDGHGTSAGGEFNVFAAGDGTDPDEANGTYMFSTFCVETNEHIPLSNGPLAGNKFTVASATAGRTGNDMASDKDKPVGGNSTPVLGMRGIGDLVNPTNPTPAGTLNKLTYGAAVLFKGFAEGLRTNAAVASFSNFLGLTYQLATTNAVELAQRISDANDMQKAIWYFQRQTGVSAGELTSNKYIKAVNDFLDDEAKLASLEIGGVRIMNLINTPGDGFGDPAADGQNVQSMLNLVPEPGSIALWMTVVSGVVLARRRRSVAR